jgi:KAP family P-loop domain
LLILLAMVGVALWSHVPGFKDRISGEMGSINAILAGLIALFGGKGVERLGRFFSSPFEVDRTKHVLDPNHEAKRSPRDLLYDDIAKIIDVYSRDAKRLYVFIDDLDRAEPSRVVEIMQTISVLLAKAGDKLVYVLAMDREKVAAAISAKHKDLAALMVSVGAKRAQPLDFGQAFLEKFVQLPFRVPPPADAAKLRTWIDGALPPGHGLGEVVGMVVPFLGANPRRIKQFVNVMHLRLHVLKAQGAPAPAFSLHQLGKITAAELLYPFFIDDLIGAPGLLNALLMGAGPAVESESYRRWSARSCGSSLAPSRPSWRRARRRRRDRIAIQIRRL